MIGAVGLQLLHFVQLIQENRFTYIIKEKENNNSLKKKTQIYIINPYTY